MACDPDVPDSVPVGPGVEEAAHEAGEVARVGCEQLASHVAMRQQAGGEVDEHEERRPGGRPDHQARPDQAGSAGLRPRGVGLRGAAMVGVLTAMVPSRVFYHKRTCRASSPVCAQHPARALRRRGSARDGGGSRCGAVSRMPRTGVTRISLLALRGYLILMVLLVLFDVLRIAEVGEGEPIARAPVMRTMSPTSRAASGSVSMMVAPASLCAVCRVCIPCSQCGAGLSETDADGVINCSIVVSRAEAPRPNRPGAGYAPSCAKLPGARASVVGGGQGLAGNARGRRRLRFGRTFLRAP